MSTMTRVLVALASVAAAFVLAVLAVAWSTPSPPRDVAFVGGWDSDDASCGGPVLWSEGRAFAACDWFYDDRALVELDPEAARATVLHRWSVDDGNTPELSIVRPCPDGELFVVAETKQTTVVVRRASGTTGSSIPIAGERVFGAHCSADGTQLFVEGERAYVAGHARDGRLEPVSSTPRADVDGRVVGAWRENDVWHVFRVGNQGGAISGPIGEAGRRHDLPDFSSRPCLVGEPGGWLCDAGGLRAIVVREYATFRAAPVPLGADGVVLHAGAPQMVGATTRSSSRTKFHGLGKLGFELADDGSAFRAERAGGAPIVVAKAAYSSLELNARALPLSGDRIAIWGGLGRQLVVLGPSLERADALGIVARTVRPLARFRASSNSIFDRIAYFTLLLAAPAWLIGLAIAYRRRREAERRLRIAAVVVVALFVIGVASFLRIASWL